MTPEKQLWSSKSVEKINHRKNRRFVSCPLYVPFICLLEFKFILSGWIGTGFDYEPRLFFSFVKYNSNSSKLPVSRLDLTMKLACSIYMN